jgi:hypothetical protein
VLLLLLSFSCSASVVGARNSVSTKGTSVAAADPSKGDACLIALVRAEDPLVTMLSLLLKVCHLRATGPPLLTVVLLLGGLLLVLLLLLPKNRGRAALGEEAGMLLLRTPAAPAAPPAAAVDVAVGLSMSAVILVEKELKRGLSFNCDLHHIQQILT